MTIGLDVICVQSDVSSSSSRRDISDQPVVSPVEAAGEAATPPEQMNRKSTDPERIAATLNRLKADLR
jgi:hypothetical protein